MVAKKKKTMQTEESLKKHKMGKEYIANRLAEQEAMENYTQLDVEDVPNNLGVVGVRKWEELIPLLQELPIAHLDKDALNTYCSLYEDFVSYRSGSLDISYSQYLSLTKEMRMIWNLLGMTMSSRLNLVSADEEVEEDEFMKLVKGY